MTPWCSLFSYIRGPFVYCPFLTVRFSGTPPETAFFPRKKGNGVSAAPFFCCLSVYSIAQNPCNIPEHLSSERLGMPPMDIDSKGQMGLQQNKALITGIAY
jgi:hypothetical protein